MSTAVIETKNLRLVPRTRDEVLASLDQMSPQDKAQISPAWLALLENSSPADPWIHGFVILGREADVVAGRCGFKGPPDASGVVEIAYGVDPEHQGKGYATEAAEALVRYALANPQVRIVRGHTLPENNASTRVLTKCGFEHVGQVIDPDDGPVWRWEIRCASQ